MRFAFSRSIGGALFAAIVLGSALFPAQASETVTYTYDVLGRLTGSSVSGGVNNAMSTGTTFDAAGNRASYAVTPTSAAPSFSIGYATATEGGTLVFTVLKTGTTGSYSVNYATSDGTATSSSDYTTTSGTLSFSSDEVSKTISVATTNDVTHETKEFMTVTLSGATGGSSIAVPAGSGTIIDND